MIMIFKDRAMKLYTILFLIFLTSCGTAKFVPTTDICSIEKHWKDSVYQVKINDNKLNDHWFLEDDAKDIARLLAKENKCMRM